MKNKNVVETSEEAPELNNAFVTTLQEFREGTSISELSENLQALVKAVRDTQKKGTLTYTITITPHGDAVALTDAIGLKLPEHDRDVAIFFATEDNTLQRDNPNQRTMEFREVQKAPGEVREVSKAS